VLPGMIVAHRRILGKKLASGAMHLITIEHLTDLGIDTISDFMENPILAQITNRIEARRPIVTPNNRHIASQWTELAMELTKDKTCQYGLGATLPFDEIMHKDTAEIWARWGIELQYANSGPRGHFAIEATANHEAAVEASLAAIPNITHS
jgi:hypothetical protein